MMANIVGELVEKRDLYSKHYLNDDGSITAEISLSPIHYKTETGEYDDIDLTIILEQNWEFEYALKKNTLRAYFNDATDIENFTLAGVELINNQGVARWITFKMLDATPTDSSYEGNRFKYSNIFLNVDLEYTVTPEKLKENIIVHDPSALRPFTFTLKIDDGLEMQIQPNNDVHFIDKETGERLWKIEAPFAVDSSEEQKQTENVVYTFGKAVYQGVEYDTITVDIQDDEFLSNAVYPIEIDPTVTIQPDASTGIDTFVQSGAPTANYGSDVNLSAGVYQGSALFETFIKFNISSIPVNADVINASVILHVIGVDESNPYGFTAHEVTADWSESITWNTKPSYNASALCTVSIANPPSAQNVIFDVTTAAKKWVNSTSPNYGVCIRSNFVNSRKTFASSDHATSSLRPSISLTYNMPPTAPTVITPNGGETWNAQHTISWNASTDKIEQYTYLQKIPTNKTSSSPISFQGVGQTFKVSSTDVIYKVGMYVNATTTNKLKAGTVVNLRYYDETTYTRGTIISTCILPADITTTGFVYVEFDNPQSFPLNTSLAVEFINSTGLGAGFYGDSGTGMTGRNYYLDSSGVLRGNNINPYELEVYYGKPSPLQYQIQLSPDNGQTWKDIVALTAAGVTSYTYDFTNEPETSLAKIRIRAYDGTSYGPWDESNGVFTIVHKTQIGTFKINTSTGILTIPIYDPNVGVVGKNQLRIQTPRGIGCFELVPTNDPNASPLRIYTPSGVKAIAKQ